MAHSDMAHSDMAHSDMAHSDMAIPGVKHFLKNNRVPPGLAQLNLSLLGMSAWLTRAQR
jgi:hypothetical protein